MPKRIFLFMPLPGVVVATSRASSMGLVGLGNFHLCAALCSFVASQVNLFQEREQAELELVKACRLDTAMHSMNCVLILEISCSLLPRKGQKRYKKKPFWEVVFILIHIWTWRLCEGIQGVSWKLCNFVSRTLGTSVSLVASLEQAAVGTIFSVRKPRDAVAGTASGLKTMARLEHQNWEIEVSYHHHIWLHSGSSHDMTIGSSYWFQNPNYCRVFQKYIPFLLTRFARSHSEGTCIVAHV